MNAPAKARPASRGPGDETAVVKRDGRDGEVIKLVHSLLAHIDHQADRSERPLNHLEGLPEAIKDLPRSSQTQTRILRTIQHHLAHQNEQSSRLNTLLNEDGACFPTARAVLDMIKAQLTAAGDTDVHLANGLTQMDQTMQKMRQIQEHLARELNRIAETAAAAESQIRRALG